MLSRDQSKKGNESVFYEGNATIFVRPQFATFVYKTDALFFSLLIIRSKSGKRPFMYKISIESISAERCI